jgi:cbb3-type cytochrome oxidase maturation protein
LINISFLPDKCQLLPWLMPRPCTRFSTKEMEIIFLLILISLLVAVGFLLAYLWAAKSGQFDDDYTPSVRMLFDNELVEPENPTEEKASK